jgi:hypothetical protein
MKTFITSINKSLEKLYSKASKIKKEQEIRPLLILLDFPLLTDYLYHQILLQLFTIILTLPDNMLVVFKTWIFNLPNSHLQKYIGVIQQYITIDLYHRRVIDENTMLATRVLVFFK